MNNRSLKIWELKLGIYSTVAIVGLILGATVVAFYLGYYSGQSVGYEIARAADVANIARIPIAVDDQDRQIVDNLVSDVYAKLNEKEERRPSAETELTDGREVAAIKTTDEAPVAADLETDKGSADDSNTAKAQAKSDLFADVKPPTKAQDHGITVVGQRGGLDGQTERASAGSNLGALLDKKTAPESDTVDAEVPAVAAAKQNGAEAKEAPLRLAKADTDTIRTIAAAEARQGSSIIKADSKGVITEQKVKPTQTATALKVNDTKLKTETKEMSVPRGWYSQVAAPKREGDAQALVKKLRGAGFKATIEHANVRGEDYFRVLVGPEANREGAEKVLPKLSSKSFVTGDPFIKMVK